MRYNMPSKRIVMTFRNDDLRNKLDDSLIDITKLFIKYNIPITHAVEPGNITTEVADWLIQAKKAYPKIIEIIQHGYAHKINFTYKSRGKDKKGEFGYKRGYQEQHEELLAGMKIMDSFFRDLWFKAICFPYGSKNYLTIKASDDLRYAIINDSIGYSTKQRTFYMIGRLFKSISFMDISIPYNLNYKPGSSLFEIDFSIGPIRKYIDEISEAEFFSLEKWKENTFRSFKNGFVGNVIHHRYHNNSAKIELIDRYLWWVKEQNFACLSQESLLANYGK
jgi:hypothetical protein